ncbi:MAG: biotin--[acetyl-CoA-carboxylase] ligase [Proteobacteria bacterium]|nr:biotin--[acetyl-CoA-carboxylase] ligase [Pseudomonadota bacterium]MBU1716866.1 biotin--[acetyl-CoA-carboxylase] ligase [Pseudomonadota bacterium]
MDLVTDKIWQEMSDKGLLADHPVRYFAEIESTNSEALRLGREGAVAGTIVVADCQSKGRGRLGRFWVSPAGTGLYFSMIMRSALLPQYLSRITLAAGLAICQALEEVGVFSQIKWPNDLLLGGKKIGGILTETGEIRAETNTLVVLGIGLNVNTPSELFPVELRSKATSLRVHEAQNFTRGDLLAIIVSHLDKTMLSLEHGGFSEILASWRQRDAMVGKELSWLDPEGKVVTGIALGPDDDGFLHIRDRGGQVHQVLSGDINLAGSK